METDHRSDFDTIAEIVRNRGFISREYFSRDDLLITKYISILGKEGLHDRIVMQFDYEGKLISIFTEKDYSEKKVLEVQ